MNYNDMRQFVLDLPFDSMTEVFTNGKQSILLFRPNHLRLLIDLKLRSRELPETKEELLIAFDKIFYGTEPLDAISPLTNIPYTQYINPIDITAVLAQLFIIEQDIGYGGKSTFDPPSLYIHGWIRTFIESEQEIDQIVYRICRNTPPAVKYTCQDNRNHPKYNPNATLLWYI